VSRVSEGELSGSVGQSVSVGVGGCGSEEDSFARCLGSD